jgi:hypothetical protein
LLLHLQEKNKKFYRPNYLNKCFENPKNIINFAAQLKITTAQNFLK